MSNFFQEVPVTVPIRDMENVGGYIDDEGTRACFDHYIDQSNTLHHYQVTPCIKQVQRTYDCNYYLHENGDLIKYDFRNSNERESVLAKNVVMFDYVHPYDFYLVTQHPLTYAQELQHLQQSWSNKKYTLVRSIKLLYPVKRVQACANGDILLEYE